MTSPHQQPPAQATLDLNERGPIDRIDQYTFEPIRGYPMLQWAGKRPFTSTQYYPAQHRETYGSEVEGWRNKLYWGDNLQVMSHLLKEYRGQVQFIYIDPPFDSKADYTRKITVRGQSAESDKSTFEEKQYTDIWTNDEYLQFMYERLILMRALLADHGSILLHCDWHKNHLLRCLLDEIFGANQFRNEIIWHYYNKMQGNIDRFASNHDTILWYTNSDTYTFSKVREERDEPVRQIKRIWDKQSQSLVNAKDEDGRVVYIESTHKTVDDVWRLSMLQPADHTENLRYPTQKPEHLIERIMRACSRPGDLVFDCFMGSGTTQAVAMRLGRRFIGADINLGAVQITTKRLLAVSSELQAQQQPQRQPALLSADEMKPGSDEPTTHYTGFEVYNVNNYDVFRNPVQARELLLEALEINPLPAGSLFDGEKDGRMWKLMPVNRIATRQDLNELINGFDYKAFQRAFAEAPTKPVERITLVCMGHEPDLAAVLQQEMKPFPLDVQVLDILREKQNLQFKRDSEAIITLRDGELIIEAFWPMTLLSKLSQQKEDVTNWRELVDSVMIDWNYDGAVLEPTVVDIPPENAFVIGHYPVPPTAGTIRVKITDLLSDALEMEVRADG